ncbi:MAG TPA: YbaN family protein [Candidatus Deferrimicrobiaceae bacterium]|nr:YbaN family protein [Candidatus Deferrimicrobiaceae bacterium]
MKGSAPTTRPLVRGILIAIGALSLAVAALGVVLPVVPTTPFVLLAAACFARASDRLHAWLLRNRWFGPPLERWQTSRSISPRAKWTAIPLIAVSVTASALLVGEELILQGLLLGTGLIVALFLLRLPTRA